jgi:hypothetical protein
MTEAAVLSKSQFAQQVGRDPAQVTRWIQAGKLSGDALVGKGRSARINLAAALRQLNIALDLGQQLAQAKPILPSSIQGQQQLDVAADQPARAAAALPAASVEALREEQLRLNSDKLRQQIERGAREDAVAAGQLVDIGAVKRALARQLQPLRALFDKMPVAIAKPISEQFGLPYNEVLISVRNVLRRERQQFADITESLERSTA